MLEALEGDKVQVSEPKRTRSVSKLVGSVSLAVDIPVPDEGPEGLAPGKELPYQTPASARGPKGPGSVASVASAPVHGGLPGWPRASLEGQKGPGSVVSTASAPAFMPSAVSEEDRRAVLGDDVTKKLAAFEKEMKP